VTFFPAGLDLLVIQPTALCNLDCRYCYVPDRQNAERLPLSILERLLTAVRSSRLAGGQHKLKILWHAGLPAGPSAGPITYLVDGKQQLLVAAGDSLFAFTVNQPAK